MSKARHRGGFSLVEVSLAVGIAAFCLVVIFGLLPAGMKSDSESARQTVAANLATGLVADLRATPSTAATSPLYGLNLAGISTLFLSEDGTASASLEGAGGGGPVYRATVSVTSPGTRQASSAQIGINWTAGIDPSKQTPAGSFVTTVGLDRN